MSKSSRQIGHRISDVMIRAFLWAMKRLPYDMRLRCAGWMMAHVAAPVTGARRRILENLDLVMPELTASERKKIARQVPDNMGRTLVEMYSDQEFSKRMARAPITGPGIDAILAAKEADRGAMLVTGHFGNYLAVRAALLSQGVAVGGLYKPMSNPFFNEHYVAAMERFGKPMFARGRRGMTEMIRHLRGGGFVGIVLDQRINNAPILDFMGKPARTALSAAEMALKFDVLLVPCYGIRQPDGTFEIRTEAPIKHSTAETMTQELNDSLEAQVRAHPGQWLWSHNRWRGAGNETSEDFVRAERRKARAAQKSR